MKISSDGTAATPAVDSQTDDPGNQEFVSRKLIRPPLVRENGRPAPSPDAHSLQTRSAPRRTKPLVAEQTHSEVFYFQKQLQSRTPLAVILQNGEQLEGVLDWYDRNSIRLSRRDHSGVLIYKPGIKYIYKKGEER